MLIVAVALATGCSGEPETPLAHPEQRPGSPGSDSSRIPNTFDPSRITIKLEVVAGGLESPLAVVAPDDGSERLFVVEQTGAIEIVSAGRLEDEPFLDVSDRLVAGGEQGLLGLALHPRFADNGLFYVNYTDHDGDTVISEFRTSGNPNRADNSSERILLRVDQPFANHNGGGLAFGPDGFLYVGLGDGGSAGDPLGNGQDLGVLLGKMLRIDVNTGADGMEYSIPADNPFVEHSGARPEIVHYGLRNPFRFSFDSATGDLWLGDVGQSGFEEIDVARAGAVGLNFGWSVTEGTDCFEPPEGCDRSGLESPVITYSHDAGCSVIGGYVYRGELFADLRGGYFFSDYCSGNLWAANAARPQRGVELLLETGRSLSSFGEDVAGELYLTDLSSGELLRLVGRARSD